MIYDIYMICREELVQHITMLVYFFGRVGGALFLLVFCLKSFFFDRVIAVLFFHCSLFPLFHLGSFANIAFCHGIIGHR